MRWVIIAIMVISSGSALAQFSTAPIENADEVVWVHAPFEVGECSICHERSNPEDPGLLIAEGNALCSDCHDIFDNMLAGFANVHSPVEDACVDCHNPHNSAYDKLLHADTVDLCTACHEDIQDTILHSEVKHDAVVTGQACLNCHNPHASNVEALLTALPFDLCVNCHGEDNMVDDAGNPMANFKTLLQESHMQHDPVLNKDCSACHETHGGANFRMLTDAYPGLFYAPYDAANYDLCFSCHEIDVFETEFTTTLTGFRDGDRNLHYLHVNKETRGRTCRACHEVHAAPQEHMVREGVPYGSSGWILKINYDRTDTGGSCAKTCHPTKAYTQ